MPHKAPSHPDWSAFEQISYCVNELDENSYSVGIFAYDPAMQSMTGKFWALTPHFDSVDALFDWARTKGFKYRCVFKPLTIGRTPC